MARTLKDSLELAAEELESGGNGHTALHEAATSLEYHLDTLAKAKKPGEIDPSQLPELERLEKRLSDLLVRGWEYNRAFEAGIQPGPALLADYAKELRAAAHQEVALVFAALVAHGGQD